MKTFVDLGKAADKPVYQLTRAEALEIYIRTYGVACAAALIVTTRKVASQREKLRSSGCFYLHLLSGNKLLDWHEIALEALKRNPRWNVELRNFDEVKVWEIRWLRHGKVRASCP